MMKLILVVACIFGVCQAKYDEKEPMKKNEKCTTEFKGCRLQAGDCECGIMVACTNPYPYLNEHQCEKDINGELDKCRKEPCENGQCVQIKTDERLRKWQCSCAGSGFYGKRCQNECPKLKDEDFIPPNYPTDCIY